MNIHEMIERLQEIASALEESNMTDEIRSELLAVTQPNYPIIVEVDGVNLAEHDGKLCVFVTTAYSPHDVNPYGSRHVYDNNYPEDVIANFASECGEE